MKKFLMMVGAVILAAGLAFAAPSEVRADDDDFSYADLQNLIDAKNQVWEQAVYQQQQAEASAAKYRAAQQAYYNQYFGTKQELYNDMVKHQNELAQAQRELDQLNANYNTAVQQRDQAWRDLTSAQSLLQQYQAAGNTAAVQIQTGIVNTLQQNYNNKANNVVWYQQQIVIKQNQMDGIRKELEECTWKYNNFVY